MLSFSPMYWDQVTMEQVTFSKFPSQLFINNNVDLEQNRLNNVQSKSNDSVDNLINSVEITMHELVQYIEQYYKSTTFQYFSPDQQSSVIYQVIRDIVNYINYLFDRCNYVTLGLIKPNNSYTIIDFVIFKQSQSYLLRLKLLPLSEDQMMIKSLSLVRKRKTQSIKSTYSIVKSTQTKHLTQYDQKCHINQDCPYYQANQNYPNNFGGCNKHTGYCQLPLGLTHLNYRLPVNPQKAICYNCKIGDTNQCCQKQLVKSFYPRLVSPDYRFEGDQKVRQMNAELLSQKGLMV